MKFILITGINKGLGKELFAQFVAKGHFVFGLLRNENIYIELLKTKPHNAEYILADISKDNCIEKIQQIIGNRELDLVINNAGIQGQGMTLETATSKEILDLINVHCLGAFRVMKALYNNFKVKDSTVINVNSRLGSIYHQEIGTFKNMEVSYSYRIAKASQNMLTTSLQLEFPNINFISLTPGRLSTQPEYQESAKKIIEFWEQGNLKKSKGILEVPNKITEW
jgi:short-subunit dehydrogenase